MYTRRIAAYQKSNAVKRMHVHTTISEYTVGQHSANMALIAIELCKLNQYTEILSVVNYCLLHDLPEYLTGDIPAPVKWRNPEVNELVQEMEHDWYTMLDIAEPTLEGLGHAICKAADSLELLLFCRREAALGNTTVYPVEEGIKHYLIDNFNYVKGVTEIVNQGARTNADNC